MAASFFVLLAAGCTTVNLTQEERESIQRAAAKVLPKGAQVEVETQNRFLSKPDLVISAHLLEGHSADEQSPYVRGDYGTHEKLTRLVRLRSAKVIKSVLAETTLPNVGGIIVHTRHGVRQSYAGAPFSGTDVAMTIYTVRHVLEPPGSAQSSALTEKQIMERLEVVQNIIPSLQFSTAAF